MEKFYIISYDVSNFELNKQLKRILSGIDPKENEISLDSKFFIELSNTIYLVYCKYSKLIEVLNQVDKSDITTMCVLEIPNKPLLTSEIIPKDHIVKDFLSKFPSKKKLWSDF